MAINYIFAIFIFITSATSLADLFLLAQKKTQAENREFIKQTQKKLNEYNQSGIGTILGISLTLIFSLLFYFFLLVQKTEYNELVYRKNTYLCFNFLDKKTRNYISNISKYNIALRAIALASASGVLTEEAQAAKNVLIATRSILHFSYLKNIVTAPYCHMTDSKDYLKNFPYELEITGALSTNVVDETTILKEENWKNTIGHLSSGIRLSKNFVLNAEYSLSSVFSSTPQVSIKEINNLALLR